LFTLPRNPRKLQRRPRKPKRLLRKRQKLDLQLKTLKRQKLFKTLRKRKYLVILNPSRLLILLLLRNSLRINQHQSPTKLLKLNKKRLLQPNKLS
jgi:hypothetical protein